MLVRNKFLIAALGAVLLLGWNTSGRAVASCGDYVMVNGEGHDQPSAKPIPPQQQQSTSQPKPKNRCPGPNCSSHHQPAPVPPAPPVPSSEKVAMTWFDLNLLIDRSARRLVESSWLIISSGASLDVFHPPRAL